MDISVLNPDGSSTGGALFTNDPTGFDDVFTLTTTGTYTVVVDPRDQQIGTVTFLLAPVADNTGTTTIGTPTTITTTTIGENATRTFTATAGQRITVSVSNNTFSTGVDLSVRRPDNTTVGGFAVFSPTGCERHPHPLGHRHLLARRRSARPADRQPHRSRSTTRQQAWPRR